MIIENPIKLKRCIDKNIPLSFNGKNELYTSVIDIAKNI